MMMMMTTRKEWAGWGEQMLESVLSNPHCMSPHRAKKKKKKAVRISSSAEDYIYESEALSYGKVSRAAVSFPGSYP